MDPSALTEATFFGYLLDPARREVLRTALRREQGSRLPLTNRFSDLACTVGDAARLGEAVRVLLEEEPDDKLLGGVLINPSTPDAALWEAYRQGRGIDRLGHRRGPRALLEALAEEHGYSEAITTLALRDYADADDPFFRAFVERHRGDFMLRSNLRHSPLVPEGRRALVADLIAEQ